MTAPSPTAVATFPLGPPDDELEWIEKAEMLSVEFAETAAEYDRSAALPVQNLQKLHDSGLDAALLPQDRGGAGISFRTWSRIVGTVARGCPATSCIWVMHVGIGYALIDIGQPEMADYYTERYLAGDRFANALSEPTSGNLFLVPLQSATKVDGGWRLDGAKRFVSGCEIADHMLVNTLVDGVPTFFGYEPDDTMEIVEIWDAMGMRATRSQLLAFEGTVLREDRRCKPLEEATAPNPVTLGLPWMSIGVAEAALGAMIEYAQNRVIPETDAPLSEMQWVQHAISDAYARLEGARLICQRVAWQADVGDPMVLAGTIEAKLAANEVAKEVAALALRVAGGTGYLKSNPIERIFRDAQAGALMAYSVEVCRGFIGKSIMGIPLEFGG